MVVDHLHGSPRSRLGRTERSSRSRRGTIGFLYSISGIITLSVLVLTAAMFSFSAGAHGDDDDLDANADAKRMRQLIKQAIASGDTDGLHEVLQSLSTINRQEAAAAVLSVANILPPEEEYYYWILIDEVVKFRRPIAFTEIGTYITRQKGKAIARDLMHALSQNRSVYVNRVIRRVLEDSPLDLKYMALDLAQNLPYRRTVDVLMPIYAAEDEVCRKKKENSDLKLRLITTLEALTRHEFGDSLPNWQGWWAGNREKGLAKIRAEGGKSTTGVHRLDPLREKEWIGTEQIPGGRVLVIKGATAKTGFDTNFDHIEHMLERLRVKHDVVEKDRLIEPGFSLKKYAAVFVNCTQINDFCQSPGHQGGEAVGNRLNRCLGPQPHDTFSGKMKPEAVEKLRKWVIAGGHLFTEDWALMELLEPAFPKFVRGGSVMDQASVDIRAARGQTSHKYLRGVFVPPVKLDDINFDDDDVEIDDEGDEFWGEDKKKDDHPYDPSAEDDPEDERDAAGRTSVPENDEDELIEVPDAKIRSVKHQWTIDNESRTIAIQSKKVRTLISSDNLKKKYGDNAVAVDFNPGKGHVLHLLSHFGKQRSRVDEATLENILINFLIDVRVKVAEGAN